jgi:hypothetical protein
LQVVWEIEPGARAFEKMELPEPKGFDQPAHLKREYPLRVFREAVAHAEARPGLRDFDILIVDEAHDAAPSGAGNFALDSQYSETLVATRTGAS